MDKTGRLRQILRRMGSVLVAYSGGADSTFLLKISCDVLGSRVLAVTADSPTYPPEELAHAREMARALGARHKVIKTREFEDQRFVSNPTDRCYFCKRELFRRLKDIARRDKLNFVIDASNVSDNSDFRPGSRAKKELNIRSPLQEAGFNKGDICKASRGLGLATWDKPALACLASRFPYGTKITPGLLERVNKAEIFLRGLGLAQVRLRHYNGLCRIEAPKEDIPMVINKRNLIVEKLKALGYNYVTVDLEGYRTGSMNEVIKPGSLKREFKA